MTQIPDEFIASKIFVIRDKKVMLDEDLAELYDVETKRLNEQIKRNKARFPEDFMFQLTDREFANLKSQIVISSWGGSRRAKPYAFTEQGVAMLSSALRSKRAIEVNIAIMRAFVKLRRMIASNLELSRKLEKMEKKYDEQFKVVFDAIRALMVETKKPKRKIGFEVKESRAAYGRRAAGRKA